MCKTMQRLSFESHLFYLIKYSLGSLISLQMSYFAFSLQLSKIPLYVCTTLPLSILLQFLAIVSRVTSVEMQVSPWCVLTLSPGVWTRVVELGPGVFLFLLFEKNLTLTNLYTGNSHNNEF